MSSPRSVDPIPEILTRLIQAGKDPSGREALRVSEEILRAAGCQVDLLAEEGVLVARTRPEATLLLSGHVDVVPVGTGWERAPHGGEVAENRLWGRGACDMLGSVACFLRLAQARPDLPFGIALTTDEETGMKGADALVRTGMLEGFEAAVVGEPTDFEIGVAEKGVLWLRLRAEGRSAHASMPEKGRNAIAALVAGLSRLHGVSLGPRHVLLGGPTMSVGRFTGGQAVNIVPERAEAEVDIRYCPPMTRAALFEAIEKALAAGPDPVRVEVMSDHAPFEASPASRLGKAAEGALRAARGNPRAVGLPYGTEASKFVALGLDLLILGPGERGLAHTNRESIALQDLEDGYLVYESLVERYAKGGR